MVEARTAAAPEVRILIHDFGAVAPLTPLTYTFRIDNPTDAAWTVAEVRTTCGCTVAELSAPTVAPGGSVDVVFGYSPPAEPADDRRHIDVTFGEESAPQIRLEVAARVRHPLTALPVRLRLSRLPHGKPHVARLTVEDATGKNLPAPRLVGDQEWLTVGPAESLPAEPGGLPRWSIPLTVAADRLPPGDHSGAVTATADQPHPDGLRVPVEVEVVPPLDPLPRQLVFAAVVGRPATVRFVVRLPAAVPADSLTLGHDLGGLLTITRTATGPGLADYTATLTPAVAGAVRGTVSVRCSDPDIPETTLPVLAHATSGP